MIIRIDLFKTAFNYKASTSPTSSLLTKTDVTLLYTGTSFKIIANLGKQVYIIMKMITAHYEYQFQQFQ